MGIWGWLGATIGGAVVLFLVQGIYLTHVLRWEDRQTLGLGYYGLPLAGRTRFKAMLRRRARFLAPILRLNSGLAKLDFRKASFQVGGVAGPLGTCSPETFERARRYQPRPEDVFVVTQMKCGTTWMQHLVYQILRRGAGDLVETGTAMYAISPWLEGRKSVPIEEAVPVPGERPSRIIKTHLPVTLCPVSAAARYIYVARHPVSCLASCIDFIETNVGGMAPPVTVFEQWFTAPDLMWWGTWPAHVKGWWDRAQRERNILFLFFEDLKRDLPAVSRQVAEFLGVAPLSPAELAQVVEKCGFQYMQRHQAMFEMHPPHLLQTNAELFVRGSADRHQDLPPEVQARIRAWCAAELAGSTFPLVRLYPDVAAAGNEKR